MSHDLFSYPHAPGYQNRDTSREAAEKVVSVREIHQKILSILAAPMTFYEVAEALGMDSRRVQPRMSELAALGQIIDGGIRHKTPYGRNGIAWVTHKSLVGRNPGVTSRSEVGLGDNTKS